MSAESTPQAIRNQYWELASGAEPGYVRVRALDSLSRLLDLFPRPKHPAFFACESEAGPHRIDPNDPAAMVVMNDEQVDRVIAAQKAAVEQALAAQADAQPAEKQAETDDAEDDEDPSGPEEDDPL